MKPFLKSRTNMKLKLTFVLSFFLSNIFGQDLPTIKGEPAEIGFQKYYNKKSPYSVEGIDETQILHLTFIVDAKGSVRDIDIQDDQKKVYLLPVLEDLKIHLRYAPWKPARIKGKNISSKIEIALQINIRKVMDDLEELINNPNNNEVFSICEIMPKFDNQHASLFREYLLKNTVLPPSSEIFVNILVLENGIIKYKIIRSNNEEGSDLVLETIKNAPNLWTPGFSRNKPVKVSLTYKLEN